MTLTEIVKTLADECSRSENVSNCSGTLQQGNTVGTARRQLADVLGYAPSGRSAEKEADISLAALITAVAEIRTAHLNKTGWTRFVFVFARFLFCP